MKKITIDKEYLNRKLNKGIRWLNQPKRQGQWIPEHALEWLAKEIAELK